MDEQVLWKLEKELIEVIDRLRSNAILAEGHRKTLNLSENGGQLSVQPVPSSSGIIFPGNFSPQSTKRSRPQFLGGSIQQRLDALGDVGSNNEDENNFLILPYPIDSEASGVAYNKGVLSPVPLDEEKTKASDLSRKIIQVRREMGKPDMLCDTISARDASIKNGGNGKFQANGLMLELPTTPLSRTCPHRAGNMNVGVWVFQCVLCPVNYMDSDERLREWQKFMDTRREHGSPDGSDNRAG